MTLKKREYVRVILEGWSDKITIEANEMGELDVDSRFSWIQQGYGTLTIGGTFIIRTEIVEPPYEEPVWQEGDIAEEILESEDSYGSIDTPRRWIYLPSFQAPASPDNGHSDGSVWHPLGRTAQDSREFWQCREELPEKLRKLKVVVIDD